MFVYEIEVPTCILREMQGSRFVFAGIMASISSTSNST